MHDRIDVWDLSVLEGAEGAGSLAASLALAILLVGCDVEGDKKNQIGCDYAHASKCSELLTSAVSCIWHPFEVGRRKVGV